MSHQSRFPGLSLRSRRPPDAARPTISGPIEITASTNPSLLSSASNLQPLPAFTIQPLGPVRPSSSVSDPRQNIPSGGTRSIVDPYNNPRPFGTLNREEGMKEQLRRRQSARITGQGGLTHSGRGGSSNLGGYPNRNGGPEFNNNASRPPSSVGYGQEAEGLPPGPGYRVESRPGTARNNTDPIQEENRSDLVGGMGINDDDFREPKFNPGLYMAERLGECSELEIRNFKEELISLKGKTSTDQQHNVYRHRTHFIEIAKEVEQVTDGIHSIRSLIAELTEVIDTTSGNTEPAMVEGTRSAAAAAAARKAMNRSSIANLEALWNNHLQLIWKKVEGSQKYLPAVPGRHIVYESGRWMEMNTATQRPLHSVHIVLLNDHLLIAVEKRQAEVRDERDRDGGRDREQDPNKASHIARHCWPLRDVDVYSTPLQPQRKKDQYSITSAVSVRVGPDTFTYGVTNKYREETDRLVTSARKAVEDIRRAGDVLNRGTSHGKGNEPELGVGAEQQYRGLMGTSLTGDKLLDFSSTLSQQIGTQIEIDGKHHFLQKIDKDLDDLDIHIALHQYEDAVIIAEQLKRLAKGIKTNSMAQDLMTGMVDLRTQAVANLITKELVQDNSKQMKMIRYVDWLARLGCGTMAREAYLGVRSDLLRKRVRQCIFEGDLHLYIYQVAYIYFAMIRHTMDIFQICFVPALSAAYRNGQSSVSGSAMASSSDVSSGGQVHHNLGMLGNLGSATSLGTTASLGLSSSSFPSMFLSPMIVWAQKHINDLSRQLDVHLGSLDKDGDAWRECVKTVKRLSRVLDQGGTEFVKLVEGVIEGMDKVTV